MRAMHATWADDGVVAATAVAAATSVCRDMLLLSTGLC